MSALIQFAFEGRDVRAVEHEGEPWFVARDVAVLLGYQNPAEAVRTHCRRVSEILTPTAGGMQTVKIIPERDVYRLIMRSKMPNAEAFEEWVVGEVLPSIRKTGAYVAPVVQVPQTMAQALRLAADQAERLEAQAAALAIAAPKADRLDRIEAAEGTFCITAAAKMLKVPPKQLHDFLRQNGWTYRRPGGQAVLAYQDKISAGLLEHKTTTLPRSDRPDKVVEQVLVTAKGLVRLSGDLGPLPRGSQSGWGAAPPVGQEHHLLVR